MSLSQIRDDAADEFDATEFASFFRRKPASVFNLPPVEAAAEEFQSALPYPHLIVDNFLADDVAGRIVQLLADTDAAQGRHFTDSAQSGKSISVGSDVPVLMELLAHKLASPTLISFMEQLTGIKSLIPDPYYNTNVGYYHMVRPGGRLSSHVDDSHHSSMAIPHSANIVVYLTPEWDDADGGGFHLFDEIGKTSLKRVSCKFNRALFFRCSPVSYHGVEPITPGIERMRHSLYFAYYNVKPARALGSFTLPSAGTGLEDDMVYHGTYFPMSARDLLRRENRVHLHQQALGALALFVPPIVVSAVRKLRRRR